MLWLTRLVLAFLFLYITLPLGSVQAALLKPSEQFDYTVAEESSRHSLTDLRTKIGDTTRSLKSQEQTVVALEQAIGEKQKQQAALRRSQNDILVALYELGEAGLPEVLRDKGSVTDYASRSEYITALASHLNRLSSQTAQAAQELESRRQASLVAKQELERIQKRQSAQLSVVQTHQDSLGRLQSAAKQPHKPYQEVVTDARAREQSLRDRLAAQLAHPEPVVRYNHVDAGAVIGYMGTTGFCYAEGYGFNTAECGHLHFEVIDQGRWADPRGYSPARLVWPFASFHATQEFGATWQLPSGEQAYDGGHTGRDLVAEEGIGAPVRAAAAGDIIEVFPQFNGWMPDGYGCYKIIDHGQGLWTLYGHLTKSSCSH